MISLFQRNFHSKVGRSMMGWLFTHASWLLPVRHMAKGKTLIAFKHPAPAYPTHILLVPKKVIPAFTDLGEDDSAFLTEMVQTVQTLVWKHGLEECGYRLIVNGGKYQDIPQLHFHLVAGQFQEDK